MTSVFSGVWPWFCPSVSRSSDIQLCPSQQQQVYWSASSITQYKYVWQAAPPSLKSINMTHLIKEPFVLLVLCNQMNNLLLDHSPATLIHYNHLPLLPEMLKCKVWPVHDPMIMERKCVWDDRMSVLHQLIPDALSLGRQKSIKATTIKALCSTFTYSVAHVSIRTHFLSFSYFFKRQRGGDEDRLSSPRSDIINKRTWHINDTYCLLT